MPLSQANYTLFVIPDPPAGGGNPVNYSMNSPKNSIAIYGMGYIGFPTACLFAEAGYKVFGIDINEYRISELQEGRIFFQEPRLAELFLNAKDSIVFSVKPQAAGVHIIAVPTPLDQEGKKADLFAVRQAAHAIASVIKDGDKVIIESTVPPKTCISVIDDILKHTKKNVRIAHCPERAFTGNTLQEMIENDRIIGCEVQDRSFFKELYASFVKGEIHLTDTLTAECCKLLENTYRDVNVAFANEITRMAEQIGINGWEVISLANKHPRVNILQPSIGVGGHCLPIDPWFLLDGGLESEFIKLCRQINDTVPHRIADIVLNATEPGTTIGILGVAYKKNIGDCRETPVSGIINRLLGNNRIIQIADPYVSSFWYELSEQERVLSTSDCIVLAMNHDNYLSVDFSRYPNIKTFVDCHNYYQNVPETIKLIKVGIPINANSEQNV